MSKDWEKPWAKKAPAHSKLHQVKTHLCTSAECANSWVFDS